MLEELKIFDKFFFLGGKMFYKTEYFVTCIPLGLRKVYILSCVYSIRTTLFKSIGDFDNGSIGASQPDRRSYVIFIKTNTFLYISGTLSFSKKKKKKKSISCTLPVINY